VAIPLAGSGRKITKKEIPQMHDTLLKLYVKFQGLKNGDEGQDLVEYALLVALIALVCITGVSHVATAVNTVFTNISNSLA
jgi:pilus assembly protein Flp/PilA